MSLEQLWGLDRLLSELTKLCDDCSVEFTQECLCFASMRNTISLMMLIII